MSCGKSSGPARRISSQTYPRSTTASCIRQSSSASTPSRCKLLGRDDKILANYLPLVLKPNVRSWLMHLPDNSISSWADLCHQFVGAFTGGHKPHGQESDLHLLA